MIRGHGKLAQNYASVPSVLVASCFVAVAVVTFVGVWVNRAAIKRFEQLEEE